MERLNLLCRLEVSFKPTVGIYIYTQHVYNLRLDLHTIRCYIQSVLTQGLFVRWTEDSFV